MDDIKQRRRGEVSHWTYPIKGEGRGGEILRSAQDDRKRRAEDKL